MRGHACSRRGIGAANPGGAAGDPDAVEGAAEDPGAAAGGDPEDTLGAARAPGYARARGLAAVSARSGAVAGEPVASMCPAGPLEGCGARAVRASACDTRPGGDRPGAHDPPNASGDTDPKGDRVADWCGVDLNADSSSTGLAASGRMK